MTAAIPDLDEWLRELTDLNYREPVSAEGSPAFGTADVEVRTELGSGRWELYGNRMLIKSGKLETP